MSQPPERTGLDLLRALLTEAAHGGATAADAVLISGMNLSVQRRLGRVEHLERSETRDVGLRVFVGSRSAIVSATSIDPAGFARLAARAVDMARIVPEDPFGGLPESGDCGPIDQLGLDDGAVPDEVELIARATAAEEAALAVTGVTNSEGASADFNRTEFYLATSHGFAGGYSRTRHSVSATALAGTGVAMQRADDHAAATCLAKLDDAAALGRSAGERAVARLDPVRLRTATLDVLYHPRVASSLLGHLVSAINGASVARGTSFLRERLGRTVFRPGIFVHDDPLLPSGLRSRPIDGEGHPVAARNIVEDGVLTTWLLDSRSARQLGLDSTGHAARGVSSPPSPAPSNVWFAPGPVTPAELMADIKLGLYVTELIGMGINMLTGDYSRGAAGFVIRDGLSLANDLRLHR